MALPTTLPYSLSIPESAATFVRSTVAYNYALGGMPFLSAASREHPILRETAPIRKQQFDAQQIPGEQSLDGWWLRSQQSFHGGAGQVFGDPAEDNQFSEIRFHSSRNVNVFTQGEVSLLKNAKTVAGSPIATVVDMTEIVFGDGTDGTFCAAGDDFITVTSAGSTTTAFTPSALALQTVTTDGSYVYVATLDGVWSAPIPGTSGGAWTWTKEYTVTGTGGVFLQFVKHRNILTVGPKVFELTPHAAAPPAALPTPKYTSPDTNWDWSGITESSNAIYVAGNNGVRGSVLRFALELDGDIPTLTGGNIAMQLPSGEVPYSVIGYLGSFVAIGTNKGVRVAIADGNGNLTYGPILFSATAPVRAWTARDRFLWCTVSRGNDGDSGLYRIDLSLQVADLRFPYATDLVYAGDVADCVAVANLGASDRVVFATTTNLYIEEATKLASSGFLRTSRVRYGTLEPKLFKLLRVRGPVLEGPLAYIILDSDDNEAGSFTFPEGDSPGISDVAITSPADPTDFISIKFVLTRDDIVDTAGGEFTGYQIKALPGGPRSRLLTLPLWCYDWERDAKGVRIGGRGAAFDRLSAIEELEATGQSITLQDFNTGTSTQCFVEKIQFMQTTPPPGIEGWGGILTVTLRTL